MLGGFLSGFFCPGAYVWGTFVVFPLSITIVPYGLEGLKKSWMVRFILKLINLSHSISKIIFVCNQMMYNNLGRPSHLI